MSATNLRFGVLFVACLLCTISGAVCAQDDPHAEQIDGQDAASGPSQNVPLQKPVNVNAKYYGDLTSYDVANLPTVFVSANVAAVPKTSKYKNRNGAKDYFGEPIEVSSGAEVTSHTDFAVPVEMGLKYERYYSSGSAPASAVTSDSLAYSLDPTCQGNLGSGPPCHGITVYLPDGSNLVFAGNPASYLTWTDGVATLTHNADGTFTFRDEDGSVQTYSAAGQIQSVKDVSGVGWTFSYAYNTTAGSVTTTVTHTNGQVMTKYWIGSVVTVTDPGGNVYTYNYGAGTPTSPATTVTLPGSPATVITYKYTTYNWTNTTVYPSVAESATVLSETDYNGAPYSYVTYGVFNNWTSSLWATGFQLADGTQSSTVAYSAPSNSDAMTATMTNAVGHVTTQQYNFYCCSTVNDAYDLLSSSDSATVDSAATTSSRVYDNNNNLQQTTDGNGNITNYTYAINGQLQTQTEAYGTAQARTTNYVWDPNVSLNRILSKTVVGWSQTTYTYNAQNRLASVTVTNLSGNGTSGQALTTLYNYTLYASGMVQTMSVTHPSPNNSDTDVSTYDAFGNLTSMANGLGQATTYSNYNGLGEPQQVTGPNGDTINYTYDARGRVQTKTTYPNGTAATWNYTYDGFGLLASVTTPDNEVTTWNRNAEMMVQTITHNDKDGTSTETFGYDPMGDVTSHVVTRGSVTGLSENATYDALGRLNQKQGMHGQTLTYAYDTSGNVQSLTNAAGHVVSYTYDPLNRVTTTTESGGASPLMPTAAPTLTAPSTSSTGSYTVSWTAVSGALAYNLQEEANGGSWALVTNTGSTSWSAAEQPSGTYGYRVQACDSAGCGPWSTTGSTTVSIPTAPATAPTLSVPATSSTGSYTVSWGSVSGAGSYTLQQLAPGGSWATVLSSAALSWSASGEASGNYSYQVRACNAVGCGPWSGVATDTVTLPPIPATPSLSAPSTNATGSYTVSWTGVSNAASYTMQEQVNGGGWTTVSASAATSWAASVANGTYGYRVQACDLSGCSAWSGTSTVVVLIPVPIAINGQSYGVGEQVAQKTTAQAEIGFAIVGGNTWQVFTANGNLVTQTVVASGAVPATAVTVQNTWTLVGIPSGDLTSGGAVTNYASSPSAISSNPFSDYTTTAYGGTSVARGEIYQLTVTFFNAAGTNVSSSTATLTANIVGSE